MSFKEIEYNGQQLEQKALNKLKDSLLQMNGALDRFKDLIDKMIQALMGKSIDVKDKTALKAALNNSIVVLNAQELYETDATVIPVTKLFNQYGIDYKFTLKGGVVINAEYKQQNKEGYEELNKKNWNSKYNELLQEETSSFNKAGVIKELSDYELFPGVFANEGQKKAIDNLKSFISSNNEEFVLIGRAGTGKTTILNKVLSGVPSSIRVGGTAVSHKAKKVLGRSIGNDKVSTLASMLAITV